MSYENKDRELNLKALCYSVARKWKQMLAAALVLAVALGAFQGWKSLSVVMDPQSLAAQQEAYEAAYAEYQGQANALNTQITMAQDGLRQHGEYLRESVLMQIDYRNAWHATVRWFNVGIIPYKSVCIFRRRKMTVSVGRGKAIPVPI